MSWMQRLKRVFAVEIGRCAAAGERVQVIASVEDPVPIAYARSSSC
jgi:hypothetical protein